MSIRVTQLYLEYDWRETPAIHVTQMYLEYDWVLDSPAGIRVTQLYLEYDYVVAANFVRRFYWLALALLTPWGTQ